MSKNEHSTGGHRNVVPFNNTIKIEEKLPAHTDSTSGGGGNMNLEQRVYNLENSVNHLRIDTTEIKTSLPLYARQEDLIKLKTQFETVLPHLATKDEVTKSRNVIIIWLIAIILGSNLLTSFAPTIKDFFYKNNSVQTSTKA